jgi:hypothetical protein
MFNVGSVLPCLLVVGKLFGARKPKLFVKNEKGWKHLQSVALRLLHVYRYGTVGKL